MLDERIHPFLGFNIPWGTQTPFSALLQQEPRAGTEGGFQNEQWVESTALPAVRNVKFHPHPHTCHQGTSLCVPSALGHQPGKSLVLRGSAITLKQMPGEPEKAPSHSSSLRKKEQHISLQEIVCGSDGEQLRAHFSFRPAVNPLLSLSGL